MARQSEEDELPRRAMEDDLGRLASALCLLEMVRERTISAMRYGRLDGILSPAVDDLAQVTRLIRATQRGISERGRSA